MDELGYWEVGVGSGVTRSKTDDNEQLPCENIEDDLLECSSGERDSFLAHSQDDVMLG